MSDEKDQPDDNRARKVEGRAKKRRYVQGTRAYTHAIANSMARRAAAKAPKGEDPEKTEDAQEIRR